MVDQLAAGALPFSAQRVQDMPAASTLQATDLLYIEQGSSAGSQRKLSYGSLRQQLLAGTAAGVTKASIGLGNVDNTPDIAKPISQPVAIALGGKAPTNHDHDAAAIKTGDLAAERMRANVGKAISGLLNMLPGDMLYFGAGGNIARVPAGQSGQFLQSQGADGPPIWTTISVSNATASAPTNVTPPTISGNAIEGQTLVANDGTWNGNPVPTFSRVWRRNGQPIAGATGITYILTAADVGAAITTLVTATNVVGSAVATSSGVSVIAAQTAPTNLSLPSISGGAVRGQILTATTGSWSGNPTPTYAYQWRRNGSNIVGATNNTYTLQAADVGAQIAVAITATNVLGSVSVVSAATAAVADTTFAPTNSTPPSISGGTIQGNTLTANDGAWAGNPSPTLTRQWKRGGVNISGATGPTYQTVIADIGSAITVTVTATNNVGTANATSAPTAVISQQSTAPVNTALPTISGTQQQGQTLTSTTGTWTGNPAPTFTRQWLRNGVAISGAVGATYLLGAADVGAQISVRVAATNSAGTQTATSAATGTISAPSSAPANQTLPTISGAAMLDSVLTASPGTWTGAPTPTFAYQWRRGGANISGATASTYTVVQADVGSAISVLVTASNTAGSASALSASTSVVTADLTIAPQLVSNGAIIGGTTEGSGLSLQQAVWSETAIAPTNTAKPTITGQPFTGQVLTAVDGTWTGTGTLSYTRQWKRNGTAISGATGTTYTLVSADLGAQITVTVTASSSYGTANATSDTTAAIAAPPQIPVNTTLPAISGTPQVGQTLTAANPGGGAIDPANLAATADLVFDENWNSIDFYTAATPSGRWATGYHWYPPEGGSLNGSMEQQWYVQKDYAPTASLTPPWTVNAGILSLTARQTPSNMLSAVGNYAYYSGMLTTYRSFSQPRGYWEARLKVPATNGFFPAFWLLPDDASWPPELDIMENLSNDLTHYYATTHWGVDNQQAGVTPTTPDLSADFHTYGCRVDDSFVTYYFDGTQVAQHAMKPDMIGKSWYTILNLAVGGWNNNVPDGSTVFPANFQCDYVRAYAPKSVAGSGVWTNNPTSYAYQWKRDGSNISGATGISYTLQEADAGSAITVTVIASNVAGASAPATSAATAAITAAPSSSWTPGVLGAIDRLRYEWMDLTKLQSDSFEGEEWIQGIQNKGSLAAAGNLTAASYPDSTLHSPVKVTGTGGNRIASFENTGILRAAGNLTWSSLFADRKTGLIYMIPTFEAGVVYFKLQNESSGDRIGMEGNNRVDWGGAQHSGWSATLEQATPKILTIQKTDTAVRVFLNGTMVYSGANTAVYSDGDFNFSIGGDIAFWDPAQVVGNVFWGTFRGALGVVDDKTDATRQKVEGWLAAMMANVGDTSLRTALPADHPYKTVAP